MPLAARVGDMHTCPMANPDGSPHTGGPVSAAGGVTTVLIEGAPAAVQGTQCTCVGPPDVISMGSKTVFIGKKPAARQGDPTAHGGSISMGAKTVFIGG